MRLMRLSLVNYVISEK